MMVDSPEKLSTISLLKFVSFLKRDQQLWKKQLEKRIEQYVREEQCTYEMKNQERVKRKYYRTDDAEDEEDEEYFPLPSTSSSIKVKLSPSSSSPSELLL